MSSLEEIYKRDRTLILNSLLKVCGDRSLCEDAIQEGYLNCIKRNNTLLKEESYWALLKEKRATLRKITRFQTSDIP